MKIGFDAKRAFHNSTGLGNYSRDLITILSSYKENSYYLYNPKPKKVDRLKLSGNLIERQPENWLWRTFSSLWRQFFVASQAKDDGVEIFHGLSGEIPRGLSNKGIKTVVTIHDLIFITHPKLYSFFDRKIHFNKHKYAVNHSDKVIAISEQTKRDIVSFLKVDPSKIEVVYQSCHHIFKSFKPESMLKKVVEKYSLPSEFVLNVSTIEKRKNQLSIIKAFKDVDSHLVIVGKKGDAYAEIKSYIDQNDIKNKITFLEGITLEELACIYQLATIFAFPSFYEGFGIPIIEAMYLKTPVIISKGGVFTEVGGPDAIYVDNTSVEDLKKQIELLLSDEVLRTQIAEKGYQFVQKFNDKDIAESFNRIYLELKEER